MQNTHLIFLFHVPSWPWSHGNRIYNYIYNQYLSPLVLWIRISIRARCKPLCDQVFQWLATGLWYSPDPPVSFTNTTDRHGLTELLLKAISQPTINIGWYWSLKIIQLSLYCPFYYFFRHCFQTILPKFNEGEGGGVLHNHQFLRQQSFHFRNICFYFSAIRSIHVYLE